MLTASFHQLAVTRYGSVLMLYANTQPSSKRAPSDFRIPHRNFLRGSKQRYIGKGAWYFGYIPYTGLEDGEGGPQYSAMVDDKYLVPETRILCLFKFHGTPGLPLLNARLPIGQPWSLKCDGKIPCVLWIILSLDWNLHLFLLVFLLDNAIMKTLSPRRWTMETKKPAFKKLRAGFLKNHSAKKLAYQILYQIWLNATEQRTPHFQCSPKRGLSVQKL